MTYSQKNNGKKSNRYCRLPRHRPKEVPSQSTIDRFSKASCGCFAAELAGGICRIGSPRPAPAGDAFGTGKSKGSGKRLGLPSSTNWTNGARSTGWKSLPMGPSHRQKKGLLRGKNQTWKGYKAYGG